MRAIRIVSGLLATLVLLTAPVTATPGGAIHGISASGWRLSLEDVPRVEFELDARMTNGGVRGSYRYANPYTGVAFTAEVRCLDVEGSVGVAGGTITEGTFTGIDFLVFVHDTGAPSFGSHGPDQVSQTYVDPGEPWGAECPDANANPFDPDPRLTIIGDAVVTDGLD